MHDSFPLKQRLITGVLILAALILLGLIWRDRAKYAKWAWFVFLAAGLLALALYLFNYAFDAGWVRLDLRNIVLYYKWKSFLDGLIIGWLTAVFASREGMRRRSGEIRNS